MRASPSKDRNACWLARASLISSCQNKLNKSFWSMHNARSALFLALLAVSLSACSILFSTFLSSTSASSGFSSFLSFAKSDGELALWRRISAFDRVVFVVVDALRSARVQVMFGTLAIRHFISQHICETGFQRPLEKCSKALRHLPWPSICQCCAHPDSHSSALESDDDGCADARQLILSSLFFNLDFLF
jgi:hypothetical protein